jgi:hypothetical protein
MDVEPWLRGTLTEVEAVRRAVLHALELAAEDGERWAAGLGNEAMFARPANLPPVGFQLRHIVRSLDRLLTYAELGRLLRGEGGSFEGRVGLAGEGGGGALFSEELRGDERRGLSEAQLAALASEMDGGSAADVMEEFRAGLAQAMERVRAFAPEDFGEPRGVGRAMLPTTVVGLLIHCAEHTQRHVGQMVTTVKVLRSAESRGRD